jgi:hypothetical protein
MRSREVSRRLAPALIAAALLAAGGCAMHEDIRSYAYEFSGQNRLGGERRAMQAMQDSCYFSGYQYFETVGPPKIEREAGAAGDQFRATQDFYCVGTVGGP